jgi:hypothetical protein
MTTSAVSRHDRFTMFLIAAPESGHVGGLEARPREYERRVIALFDRALLR